MSDECEDCSPEFLECWTDQSKCRKQFTSAPTAEAPEVEARWGLAQGELREMMKPFIKLMHRRKLPWVTIKLNGTIGTISTIEPPNAKGPQ